MDPGLQIPVETDTATRALERAGAALAPSRIQRAIGGAVVRAVQEHLASMPPNKRGWPTTHFYDGAARGTDWEPTANGITVSVENYEHPGAMRQRFHGGLIEAKDKLLTIPAQAEFYGHRAGEFTDLRLAVFSGGSMALMTPSGGAGKVDFATGQVKGAGRGGQVAYWLVESVNQAPDPSVLPTNEELGAAAVEGLLELCKEGGMRV